jgi:hypothetical protein
MFGGLKDKLRAGALGVIARKIEGGDFGPGLAKAYKVTKGKVTWTSAAVAIIAAAAAYWGDSGTAALIAQVAVIGTGLGLIRKGVDLRSPGAIPPELKEDLELALSWLTVAMKVAQLVVLTCQDAGQPWAVAISGQAQLAAFALSSITGFMATLLHEPKALPVAQNP